MEVLLLVAVRWWLLSADVDVAAAVQDVTSCPERSSRNGAAGCCGGTGLQGVLELGTCQACTTPPFHHSKCLRKRLAKLLTAPAPCWEKANGKKQRVGIKSIFATEEHAQNTVS